MLSASMRPENAPTSIISMGSWSFFDNLTGENVRGVKVKLRIN